MSLNATLQALGPLGARQFSTNDPFKFTQVFIIQYDRYIYIHKYVYTLSYIINLYHIISYYIILYHIISYYIILYHVISYYIILYHIISCYITLYHIISCYITLNHIISYHIIPYSIYHIIFYISYHILYIILIYIYNIIYNNIPLMKVYGLLYHYIVIYVPGVSCNSTGGPASSKARSPLGNSCT